MRKNILALLLLAVLTGTGVCAELKPEVKMFNDLKRYTYHSEMMYSDILWVLDYIGRFDRERSWESLQLARASAAIAKIDIKRRKLPQLEMTAEDYITLMKRRIDVSFLEHLDTQFKAEQTMLLNTLANLNNSLMYEVFLKDDWDICVRNADNTRKFMNSSLQYLANTADWIITALNKPAMTKEINSFLAEHCPQTHARQRKKAATLKSIEADANELSKQMGKFVMEDDKILGAKKNVFNATKYALEKKDTNWFRQNVMRISNMPPLISLPKWLTSDRLNMGEILYSWEENGKLKILRLREKLDRIPDSCMMTVNGVSLPQVKDYQKELEEDGLPCSGVKEKDGKYYVLYRVKGGDFTIIWEDGKVIICMRKDPVCFIPYLYLLARKNL